MDFGITVATTADSWRVVQRAEELGFTYAWFYDTQMLKRQYDYVAGTELAGKAVIMGALNLYLDFINMFMFLLSFMGDRR